MRHPEERQNLFSRKVAKRKERLTHMDENQLSKIIVDCCYRIHKKLGPGLLESVYLEILIYELKKAGLACEKEVGIPVCYEDVKLDLGFRADLIVNPETCIPPTPAGGSRRRPREVALLKGASGSCRRGLH
jgi:hypothetical protein